MEHTDIVRRQTIAEMVEAFHQAETEIREAYRLLDVAQARLVAGFGSDYHASFETNPRNRHMPTAETHPDSVMLYLRGQAWGCLVNRLELRKMMSTERRNELDRQLEQPEKLPPVTDDAITGMIASMVSKLGDYQVEAVKEVFDWLRPRSNLVTNSQYEVGEKVIVRAFYDTKWNTRAQIDYGKEQHFRNLDNVFSMLDGQGPIKTHCGPLLDLYKGTNDERPRFGEERETEYFAIKIHKNGNAHIRFKRQDLVQKLNAIAGGKNLKHDTEATRQA